MTTSSVPPMKKLGMVTSLGLSLLVAVKLASRLR